jgi:GDP-mannose 6-dehydrogenase
VNISIFGLGYVGTVSAVCLSNSGHRVVGVDANPFKVESINQGRSPIVEPGVDELLHRALNRGAFPRRSTRRRQ